MKEEIFGPVLPIVAMKSVQDMMTFINEGEKPLSLYVFSNNKSHIETCLSATSSGSAVANDCLMQATVGSLPFGGVGESGMGSYHG